MENTEKKPDLFDDELQQLMGDQYTDLTNVAKPAEQPEPVEPAEKTEPTDFDLLGSIESAFDTIRRAMPAAKWAVTFGGLAGLIIYWLQTGLMDPAAAVPSLCVCTMLGGYGVGKNTGK
jgi:hypothetical protein